MRRRRSKRPTKRCDARPQLLDEFLARLQYIGGDAQADEDPLYDRLRVGACQGSQLPVFYLATPPVDVPTRSPRSSLRRASSETPAVSWSRSRSGPISPPRAS